MDPKYKPVIFNDAEKNHIAREFHYVENDTDWPEASRLWKLDKDEHDENF